MWWADNGNLQAGGNVTFPKSCEVEYYDHETSSWKKITAMTDETGANVSSVGVKYGSADQASDQPGNHLNGNNRYWNQVTFDTPVKTTQIRMNIDRNGYGSNGITVCIILFTMLRMELRMLFAFGAIPANIRSQR